MFLKKYTIGIMIICAARYITNVCMEQPPRPANGVSESFHTADGRLDAQLLSLHHRLFDVLEEGNAFDLVMCIRAGGNVNWRDAYGATPLCVVTSKKNQLGLVRILLSHGANVKASVLKGMTALHLASMHNDTDVMRELIAHGAPINARTASGQTPIFLAILDAREAAVHLLLEQGADLGICLSKMCMCHQCKEHEDNGGATTPLHLALLGTNPTVVSALLAYGAEYAPKDEHYIKLFLTKLEQAVLFDGILGLRVALKKAESNLRDALKSSDPSTHAVLKSAHSNGLDVALILAIGRGDVKKIILLLSYGIAPKRGLSHTARIIMRLQRMNASLAHIHRYRYIQAILTTMQDARSDR